MQRQISPTIFPVSYDQSISYSTQIPSKSDKFSEIHINDLERKIADRRGLNQFVWTEAMHLPENQAERTKVLSVNPSGSPFYPVTTISYQNYVICEMGQYGLGVFAKNLIRKGTFLFLYSGEYRFATDENSRELLQSQYLFAFSDKEDGTLVDARKYAGISALIQHAPRIRQDKVAEIGCATENVNFNYFCYRGYYYHGFFADKDIQPNEQLVFDYGDDYWQNYGSPPAYFTRLGEVISGDQKDIGQKVRTWHTDESENYFTRSFDIKAQINISNYIRLRFVSIDRIYLLMLLASKELLISLLSDLQLEYLYHQQTQPKYLFGSLPQGISKEQKISAAIANPNAALYHLDAVIKQRLNLNSHFDFSMKGYAQHLSNNGMNLYKDNNSEANNLAINNWQAAKKVYKKMSDNENLLSCYWNLGNALFKSGLKDKAIKKLDKGKALKVRFFKDEDSLRSIDSFNERINKFNQ